ncbi:hypothetical protein EJ02DRAFT_455174 [Clathrospora elynae]|uniref:Apple domain-containing protein n=1 Tax=Clathrospora elynae TaxID=706981 RepID=A0A6A5SPE5_9PLEO|nr:hypothetical protein EJ02DRAFT_455174 [Clathrospora elynae]
MRPYIFFGAAALVAASPAPQAIDTKALNAIRVGLAQGPPVGVGPAAENRYNQLNAQNAAAAAATGAASAQQVKRNVDADLEARWFNNYNNNYNNPKAVITAAPTAVATAVPANPLSTNVAPSSCTPVAWTNTFAFTADPACATAIEVGTYCGFINPEDPCAAQPNAYGPVTDGTSDDFEANPVYHKLATSAKTPPGYAQSFSDLSGSVSGSGYLGYKELTSYSVAECAAYCDGTSTCTGFNLYIERAPKWNPRQCSCNAPDSITRFKCSIWGMDVTNATATNVGQGQDGFQVVVAGSNGYNKQTYSAPTPPSCSNPQSCGNKLHNQQPYCMGQQTFPGPFDPSLCAAYAQKQNQVNKQSGFFGSFMSMWGSNKGGCVQFQAAYLEKNGVGFGTHCRLFTKKFTPAQASLDISVGGTSQWGCQKSYTWDVDVNASFNWGGWSYMSRREE